jgi:predicted Zn-dependent protease
MLKQNTWDGGHTALTDHRISRRPPSQADVSPVSGELVAWRQPPAGLAERNLGLAYLQAGFEAQSASELARGFQILSTVEKSFPDDPAVLNAMGQALLGGDRALEAARLFDRVLSQGPESAATEADSGRAWMEAGDAVEALKHLKRAVQLDPLNLPAAEALMRIYQSQGDQDKAADLSDRVRQALGPSAPEPIESSAP